MNDKAFQYFTQIFNKTYSSPEEIVQRCAIFNHNLALVESINRDSNIAFTAKIYPFSDLSCFEFHHKYLGSVDHFTLNSPDVPDPHAQYHTLTANVTAFRWGDNVAGYPLDQGQCESCFDFSTLNQVASANAKNSGSFIELAEQEILDCGYDPDACHNGGNEWHVYQYARDNGVCPRSSYRNYDCECGSCPARPTQCQPVKISNFYTVPPGNVEAIKQAVSNVPVAAAFYVNGDFQNYRGGIFSTSTCPPQESNHVVMITGWGVDNGQNYWWVKNSWGPNWGEAGYVRFLMGINVCNIETYVTYSVA